MGQEGQDKRAIWSWAFYDWANSAFATTVIAGFFPIFYKESWRQGVEATQSTFELGLANSGGSLVVAAMAPLLGALADQGRAKKAFLALFTGVAVIATACLSAADNDLWMLAAFLYALGLIGFSSANVFYDSLLVDVSDGRRTDSISALGYSLGYLGGGLLFTVNVLMTRKPEWFGLADSAAAVRASFVTVAAWWALFTIPLLLFVKEKSRRSAIPGSVVTRGFVQLGRTFRHIRRARNALMFLLAYWLYIDGVNTIIKMAVDYGLALGFTAASLIVALLIVQFVGFPAAILFGYLGRFIGAKPAILVGLGIYVGVTLWGVQMTREWEFYVLAVAIGCVQGGVQSLSRSMFARITPPRKSAEFFGFYNMVGKFATLIGPVLVGTVAYASGSSRLSMFSLIILFVVGGLLLLKVEDKPEKDDGLPENLSTNDNPAEAG